MDQCWRQQVPAGRITHNTRACKSKAHLILISLYYFFLSSFLMLSTLPHKITSCERFIIFTRHEHGCSRSAVRGAKLGQGPDLYMYPTTSTSHTEVLLTTMTIITSNALTMLRLFKFQGLVVRMEKKKSSYLWNHLQKGILSASLFTMNI